MDSRGSCEPWKRGTGRYSEQEARRRAATLNEQVPTLALRLIEITEEVRDVIPPTRRL